MAGASLGLWLLLPSDHITVRALGQMGSGQKRLLVSDGLTELIAVTEHPGQGRTLYTNGHAMSSTMPLSQRYMRALAHIPLLSMDRPETVLVIGFGVGNTTHAATLHPSVRRVELADLSRDILSHAEYFEDANRDVLSDPKVVVHINDGRQHLQMQPPGSYDLVMLEPPPIAYAGVSALYSREFYALARSRLKPNGYVSQWLPTYQVPPETALAMVRAFVDVFPQAVLLSGAESDLVLLGINGDRIEIDPEPRLRSHLEQSGATLGSGASGPRRGSRNRRFVRRIAENARRRHARRGTGDGRSAAPGVRGAIDAQLRVRRTRFDHRSRRRRGLVPAMLHGGPACPRSGPARDLLQAAGCGVRCGAGRSRRGAPPVRDGTAGGRWQPLPGRDRSRIGGHYNVLGLALAQQGQLDGALQAFRRALELDPDDAAAHWHVGSALASGGAYPEATSHLARSVELDPANSRAHSDLGLLLAFQGRLDEGVDHLERAIALDPQADDLRKNLEAVLQQRQRAAGQP